MTQVGQLAEGQMAPITPEEKVLGGKIAMEKACPFISRILFGLMVEEMPERLVEAMGGTEGATACVDPYGHLYWHPNFIDKLSMREVGGLLAHEVFHIADEHIFREKGRDHDVWRMACELKADWFAVACGLTLPAYYETHGVSIRENRGTIKFREKQLIVPDLHEQAVEQLYAYVYEELSDGSGHIPDNIREQLKEMADALSDMTGEDGQGSQDGKTPESQGGSNPAPCPKQAGMDPDEVKELVEQAREESVRRGTMPGATQRWLETGPKQDQSWRRRLAEAYSPLYRGRRSYKKVHKRSQSMGFVMPGYTKDGARLVIHIDTSGSVMPYVERFYQETRAIVSAWKQVRVELVLCDCATISEGDVIRARTAMDLPDKLEVGHMGGGTSHKPVVDWILENAADARVFVSITDGYSDIEKQYPRLPLGMRKVLVMIPEGSASDMEPHVDTIIEITKEG